MHPGILRALEFDRVREALAREASTALGQQRALALTPSIDPEEIAERLRQLLADDELRQSLGAKGREIALDRFHPAQVAVRTRDVYVRAIQSFQRR